MANHDKIMCAAAVSRFRTGVTVRVNNERWASAARRPRLFRVGTGVLYDLEAGIAFLFVDLRAVPASSTRPASRNGQTADTAGVLRWPEAE